MSQSQQYSEQEARWSPRVTVATVVEREGRFLLIEERVRGELVLNQPAGHLEPNESLLEAAVRETLEETGCKVKPTALLGIYRWDAPSGRTFLRTTVIADCLSEDPEHPLDDGIERALWLTPEELDAHPSKLRTPLVRRTLDDYLSGRRHSLDVLIEY